MSRSAFIALVVAAIIAVGLALTLVDRPDEAASGSGSAALLLPGLADRVNAIEALEIIGPEGETVASLYRSRERWRMRQKDGYEADFARIHQLLRDLAGGFRLEQKTGNAQWYGRLGVAAPGKADGSGLRVEFPGLELPDVTVGRRDPAGLGRYVRLAGEAHVWLIDRDIDLSVERMQWLERAIMDIPAADIRSVSIAYGDGDRVELRPGDEEGSSWVMLDVPADREVKPGWQLAQTAGVLARLNMEDVRPADSVPVPEDAVTTTFRTHDGMQFIARSFRDDQGNWVRFRVVADEAGDDHAEADGSGLNMDIDLVAVDGRLSPWQFAISDDRFKRLRRTSEDLLLPLKQDQSAEE